MEKLISADPNRVEYKHDLSQCYTDSADNYEAMKDFDRALEYYKKALIINTELCAIDPQNINYTRFLQFSYSSIAGLYNEQEKYTETVEYYRKSLDLEEKLLSENPDDEAIILDYSNTLTILGFSYLNLSQDSNSLECFEKEYKIFENRFPHSAKIFFIEKG